MKLFGFKIPKKAIIGAVITVLSMIFAALEIDVDLSVLEDGVTLSEIITIIFAILTAFGIGQAREINRQD